MMCGRLNPVQLLPLRTRRRGGKDDPVEQEQPGHDHHDQAPDAFGEHHACTDRDGNDTDGWWPFRTKIAKGVFVLNYCKKDFRNSRHYSGCRQKTARWLGTQVQITEKLGLENYSVSGISVCKF